jgi:hypothetical protein
MAQTDDRANNLDCCTEWTVVQNGFLLLESALRRRIVAIRATLITAGLLEREDSSYRTGENSSPIGIVQGIGDHLNQRGHPDVGTEGIVVEHLKVGLLTGNIGLGKAAANDQGLGD